MKNIVIIFVLASNVALAGTNLVSNTAVITNWTKEVVTFTRNADGTATVNDPSGRLVGTSEAKALQVAANRHAELVNEADVAANSAMWGWEEFMRTNNSKIVYLAVDFGPELSAMAPNLVGWIAKSWYDGEMDHYMVWFNREMNYAPGMDFRFKRENETYWEYGSWANWDETETIDGLECRELRIQRRYKDSVLKTGSYIVMGGREGFDVDPHKINLVINNRTTLTGTKTLANFKSIMMVGTNRVETIYNNGVITIENGTIKGVKEYE